VGYRWLSEALCCEGTESKRRGGGRSPSIPSDAGQHYSWGGSGLRETWTGKPSKAFRLRCADFGVLRHSGQPRYISFPTKASQVWGLAGGMAGGPQRAALSHLSPQEGLRRQEDRHRCCRYRHSEGQTRGRYSPCGQSYPLEEGVIQRLDSTVPDLLTHL
jgi:hypothetical protein